MTDFALRFTQAAAHVLWAGTLVALAVFAFERLFVRTAAGRHALNLLGLMLTALILPVAFFVTPVMVERLAPSPRDAAARTVAVPAPVDGEPVAVVENFTPLHPDGSVEAAETTSAVSPSPVITQAQELGWERIAPWVAGAYLIGLLAMLVRMGCGFAASARIRRLGETLEPGVWTEALQRMGDAVKVRVKPALRWSREVAAPVLIGFVKPAILLPMTLTCRLSPAQIEAVLAHELAHLQRQDAWALAVQRMVEAVLFFHPAVWWMSRQMEVAREEACDDLVLEAGCDPADYAEALVICSECRLERKGMLTNLVSQLAATGKGGDRLRRRVLRLIGSGDDGAVRLGQTGWVLGVLLITGVALSLAAGAAGQADLADFNFDEPPPGYEKGVQVADRNQRFKADNLQFQASPLRWAKEGWLRLPAEGQGPGEELFLNLGLSGGYEIVEIRLFDHATRELIHDSAWQYPGEHTKDFFVERIGSGNWLRLNETGGVFPDRLDVWLRLATERGGHTFVLTANTGASASHDGGELVVTALLAGRMNERSDSTGEMQWDLATAHDQNRELTVNIENRGNRLDGRYHLVAVEKDGSRHPMDHTHFWDFQRMGPHASFQMDVALDDLDHFELVPFKDRHKFFFNGLEVPRKESAGIADLSGAIAERVVRVIQTQRLPFVTEQRLRQIQTEFATLVEAHQRDDLNDERKRAILTSIEANGAAHLFLNRYHSDEVRLLNQTYIEFPDRIKTLKWEVFMAITRAPLDSSELARLESQRRWMRDIIKGLPDERHLGRKDVLLNLEALFADPLSTQFDRPMSEAQFASFQNALMTELAEAKTGVKEDTPTGSRFIKPHNPLPFIVNDFVVKALWTQYLGKNSNTLFPLFDDDRVGGNGAGNGYVHLGFMSNRRFLGDSRALGPMENDYTVVDATTGYPDSAPPDQHETGKFAAWVTAQDKGDFGLSRAGGTSIIAVRGAKFASLNVTNWIEADAMPNDVLRATIEAQQKQRIDLNPYYTSFLAEYSTHPPMEFIGPYIGVLTKEGRLAVVQVEGFSGPEQIDYRVRPRAETEAGVERVQSPTSWGDPTEGVAIRVERVEAKPGKAEWPHPDIELTYSATNNGLFILHLPENGDRHQVEVDGRWYEWVDPRLSRMSEGSEPSSQTCSRKASSSRARDACCLLRRPLQQIVLPWRPS